MNILITGGAGYIGTELVYQLETNPTVNEIIVYDNLRRSNYNLFLGRMKLDTQRVRFVKGEILLSINRSTIILRPQPYSYSDRDQETCWAFTHTIK